MTDYTKLCAALRGEFSDNVREMCADDKFECDRLCAGNILTSKCIVFQAADVIERLQADNIGWRKKYIKSECDAINQTGELVTLHAENADLRRQLSEMEYRLMAVMHSVDKWFEEIPDENEETRAADAREIALNAIDILKTDIDILKAESADLRRQLAEKTELLDKAVAWGTDLIEANSDATVHYCEKCGYPIADYGVDSEIICGWCRTKNESSRYAPPGPGYCTTTQNRRAKAIDRLLLGKNGGTT